MVETAIALLLVVLSLGSETLDLMRPLSVLPPFKALASLVPTASVTVSDLLVALLAVAVGLRWLVGRSGRQLPKDDTGSGKALLAYLAIVTLTTLIAQLVVPFAQPGRSLLYLVRLAVTVAPCLVVVFSQPSRKWLRRYVILYAILALVPTVRAVCEAWSPELGGFQDYTGLYVAAGFAPMGLGTYLSSVAGLSAAAVTIRMPRSVDLRRILACLILLTAMFTVIFVQKRAPIAGLAAALVAATLLPRPSHRHWLLLGALIMLLAVGIVVKGGIIDRTFVDLPNASPVVLFGRFSLDFSITNRLTQWQYALQAATQYPMGVGFRAMSSSPYGYPHNLYLQILAESSIAGLACFAWLMWSILRAALRLWRKSDWLSVVLGAGVFCSFVSMLVQGIFEESFHNWDGMSLLWLLAGLAAVQFAREQAASSTASVPADTELCS